MLTLFVIGVIVAIIFFSWKGSWWWYQQTRSLYGWITTITGTSNIEKYRKKYEQDPTEENADKYFRAQVYYQFHGMGIVFEYWNTHCNGIRVCEKCKFPVRNDLAICQVCKHIDYSDFSRSDLTWDMKANYKHKQYMKEAVRLRQEAKACDIQEQKQEKKSSKKKVNVSKGQEYTRKKHQRIKCNQCGAYAPTILEDVEGVQIRQCSNGHKFVYNYQVESLSQGRYNWNMKSCKVGYSTKARL